MQKERSGGRDSSELWEREDGEEKTIETKERESHDEIVERVRCELTDGALKI